MVEIRVCVCLCAQTHEYNSILAEANRMKCAHTTSQSRQRTIIHQATSIISQHVIVSARRMYVLYRCRRRRRRSYYCCCRCVARHISAYLNCYFILVFFASFIPFIHFYICLDGASMVCLCAHAFRGKFSPPLFGANESTILHNRRNAHRHTHTHTMGYRMAFAGLSNACIFHCLNINYGHYRRTRSRTQAKYMQLTCT